MCFSNEYDKNVVVISRQFHWDLQQFDVKNVFLHGKLEKVIYIDIPFSLGGSLGTNKVYRPKTALYVSSSYIRLGLKSCKHDDKHRLQAKLRGPYLVH